HVLHRRLDLVLVQVGTGEAHGLAMAFGGKEAGGAHRLHLLGRLDESHLSDDRRDVADRLGGGRAVAVSIGSSLAQQPRYPAIMASVTRPVPQLSSAQHHAGNDFVQSVDLVGGVGPEALPSTFYSGPVPVPGLHLRIPRTHEENVLTVGMP